MQAVEQKPGQSIFFEEIHVETVNIRNCSEVRERLDELFGGGLKLEDMPAGIKRSLFSHLETCRDCCRAFDVRMRFRPVGRSRIY